MSQVPSFIIGDDGQWYQNPILGVEGQWFICFDDDEPDELVVAVDLMMGPSQIIKKYNLPFRITGKFEGCGSRMMSSTTFRQARRCWLQQTGPIPVALLIRKTKVFKDRPQREGVFSPDFEPEIVLPSTVQDGELG